MICLVQYCRNRPKYTCHSCGYFLVNFQLVAALIPIFGFCLQNPTFGYKVRTPSKVASNKLIVFLSVISAWNSAVAVMKV